MMTTVPHVTSGSGHRKFQADGVLFDSVHRSTLHSYANRATGSVFASALYVSTTTVQSMTHFMCFFFRF